MTEKGFGRAQSRDLGRGVLWVRAAWSPALSQIFSRSFGEGVMKELAGTGAAN